MVFSILVSVLTLKNFPLHVRQIRRRSSEKRRFHVVRKRLKRKMEGEKIVTEDENEKKRKKDEACECVSCKR
ncbi:hypothetical protein TNCV_2067971 [Trichonephila clavipes]|uniref:Uncharacterized protein n=1 Tax=Trichonephila clavipes TaxID=2585209 RepID=A0A8X6W3M4_TRICX|nr:hypothetical protein TNCV_2067971 [Trichonephila clavipes]